MTNDGKSDRGINTVVQLNFFVLQFASPLSVHNGLLHVSLLLLTLQHTVEFMCL